jgi:undecaprenyl-diphosphatase
VLDAALLGIVQGLTEFLPISSTAHLLLGGRFLGYDDPGGVFTVMIQLGAVLAVMWLYRARIVGVLTGLPSDPDARRFALMIVVAFLPALAAGALLSDFVKAVLYESPGVIATAFVAGGVVMLAVERAAPVPVVQAADRTPLGRALLIGVCQTLALVPGVSRSGATIVGARVLGLDRAAAAEFSFFLAMPTMLGAFTLDLYKNRDALSFDDGALIAVGFIAAFVSGLFVVRSLLDFVSRRGFAPFAWWRIAIGSLGLIALLVFG